MPTSEIKTKVEQLQIEAWLDVSSLVVTIKGCDSEHKKMWTDVLISRVEKYNRLIHAAVMAQDRGRGGEQCQLQK